MFLQIDNCLTPAEIQEIAELAAQAKFVAGRRSSPQNQTKDNVIADPNDPTSQKASQIALPALQRNEQSRDFAFPQRMALPTLARSNPSDHEGGELVIYLGSEVVQIKGNAGSAVFYASTKLHQVEPVRSGSRLVMITFIESQIPDPLQREVLFALGEVRAYEGGKMDWRMRTQLKYVFANLHRMWAR